MLVRASPIIRAEVSTNPPGGLGTTIVMGLVGKLFAKTACAEKNTPSTTRIIFENLIKAITTPLIK
jgi:hypothetical protein